MILGTVERNARINEGRMKGTPDEDEKCLMCGQPDTRMHAIMCCEATREERKETHRKIIDIINRRAKYGVKNFPCWWSDVSRTEQNLKTWKQIEAFPNVWGAQGVIPTLLIEWISNVDLIQKDQIDAAIEEIQTEILKCAQNCYKVRMQNRAKKENKERKEKERLEEKDEKERRGRKRNIEANENNDKIARKKKNKNRQDEKEKEVTREKDGRDEESESQENTHSDLTEAEKERKRTTDRYQFREVSSLKRPRRFDTPEIK